MVITNSLQSAGASKSKAWGSVSSPQKPSFISAWRGKARPHGFLWGLRGKKGCETYQQHNFFHECNFFGWEETERQHGLCTTIKLPSAVHAIRPSRRANASGNPHTTETDGLCGRFCSEGPHCLVYVPFYILQPYVPGTCSLPFFHKGEKHWLTFNF